jgi:hypothetical protein
MALSVCERFNPELKALKEPGIGRRNAAKKILGIPE